MRTPRPVDPCDFVIFGGTGDLAVRKLLPALYLRDRDGQLTEGTRIIGVAKAGSTSPATATRSRPSWPDSSPPSCSTPKSSSAFWPGCDSSAST